MTSYLTLPLRICAIYVAQVLLHCPLRRPLFLWLLGSYVTSYNPFITSVLLFLTMVYIYTNMK